MHDMFLGISNFLEEISAAAKSLQLRPTLCDPIDGSPPGSAVPGILQARTLEWVAISFCIQVQVQVNSLFKKKKQTAFISKNKDVLIVTLRVLKSVFHLFNF